jgi:hypothetical protein
MSLKRALSETITALVSSTLSVVEGGDVRFGGDEIGRGVDLADGALDLRVTGVADQDDGAALAHVALGLVVDLGDQRARRVEHRQVAGGRGLDHRLGDAVGAEHGMGAVRHLGQLLDEDGALGLQAVHDMAVVHDLVADIDRRLVFLDGPLDDVDRPHHAGAETARLGQDDPARHGCGRGAFFQIDRRIAHVFHARATPHSTASRDR